jgi:hypothetical protein
VTVGVHLPLVEHNDARAQVQDHFQIVRSNDLDRRELPQNVHKLAAAARIQVASGFV